LCLCLAPLGLTAAASAQSRPTATTWSRLFETTNSFGTLGSAG
jgi:hypothetical protein